MDRELQVSNQKNAPIQPLEANEVLTLQKMRDLEQNIKLNEEEQEKIKNIIKIDNVELNPMLKLNEAYLVELENQKDELAYQLYTEKGLIGISNEEGLIKLDERYIAEMDEKFGEYGPEYLIPQENKTLDPIVLKEQSLQPYEKNQLEERERPEEKQKVNNDEKMSKMEKDLGCDITSCVEIQDEDFSEEVLGHQTGHEEKYIGYSKSRNTFILIGKNGQNYEEIQDICGAQGGGEAARKTYCEYDEQGRPIDVEAPSFVMTRNDGKDGALALDMHYGAICVSNLTPNEKEPGKYDSEEIRMGHSIRPTSDEIELAEQREQKEIEQKQQEVKSLESDVERGDNKTEELEQSQRELEQLQDEVEDDDDLYDWSTGRPIPRH